MPFDRPRARPERRGGRFRDGAHDEGGGAGGAAQAPGDLAVTPAFSPTKHDEVAAQKEGVLTLASRCEELATAEARQTDAAARSPSSWENCGSGYATVREASPCPWGRPRELPFENRERSSRARSPHTNLCGGCASSRQA